MLRKTIMLVAVAALLFALAPVAQAAPIGTFHYAFVTSTSRNATSTDIADYNAHVQAAADAGSLTAPLGLSWTAIASTSTMDAKDNMNIQGPIYLLDGTLIADDGAYLWNVPYAGNAGDPGTLYAGILLDENGVDNFGGGEHPVWTGTQPDGTKGDGTDFGDGPWGYHLGSDAAGNAIWGDGNGWEHRYNGHWVSEWQDGPGGSKPFYAISEAVPEPAARKSVV